MAQHCPSQRHRKQTPEHRDRRKDGEGCQARIGRGSSQHLRGLSPGCHGYACSQPSSTHRRAAGAPQAPNSPGPTAEVYGTHLKLQLRKQDEGLNSTLAKAQTCLGRTPKAGGASPPQPSLARLQRILGQGSPQTWDHRVPPEPSKGRAHSGEAQRQREV